jgi:hypothetical protein
VGHTATELDIWVNVDERETDFLRGYSFQGGSGRDTWKRGGQVRVQHGDADGTEMNVRKRDC